MGLENSTTISGLNASWPLGTDPKSEGDNHIRLIKAVLQADGLSLSDTQLQTIAGALTVAGILTAARLYVTGPLDVVDVAHESRPTNGLVFPSAQEGVGVALGGTELYRFIAGALQSVGYSSTDPAISGFNLQQVGGLALKRAEGGSAAGSALVVINGGTETARIRADGDMDTRGFRQYHRDNILDTVAQSAGVPTGGIISNVSNGNGRSIRFADGTQICTHTASEGAGMAVASGALFVSPADLTWTFPQSFTAAPVVHGLSNRSGMATGVAMFGAIPTTNVFTYRNWSSVSLGALTTSVRLTAIGRWF